MEFTNNIKKFFENNIEKFTYNSCSEIDTIEFAKEFAKYLNLGDIVSLNGELGTGKTVFMKGIAKHFNILEEVSSPTFTIVNEYFTNTFPIYHFDVYRIESVRKFEDTIGTDYFFYGLCIVEWGNIIESIFPKNTIIIDFTKIDEIKRKIEIRRI